MQVSKTIFLILLSSLRGKWWEIDGGEKVKFGVENINSSPAADCAHFPLLLLEVHQVQL
jgi:hypothetical protein